ncbi:hypothetical protein Psi01_02950 [Planobispora siamensis]|uniref:Uncharacterized protein n=1 Tax=Planobispora siamensis TaxID=936338 RepID=A0A8J3SBR8_9ACTN|nr:hypothetical protein Psi01_02950 [Planobispora siamensis]
MTVRQARRRRRGLVLAAAVATCLVAGVTSAAVWRASGPEPAATPQPAVTTGRTPPVHEPRTVEEIAPPLQQVMPSVMAEVPRKVPDGRAFTPKSFIDSRTVLGYVSKKGYDPAPEWWAYRLDPQAFRRLATVGRPVAPMDSPAVGEGVIAWYEHADRDIRIMTIPVTGGAPRAVTSFPAERDVDEVNGDSVYGVSLAVGDGKIFWSSNKSGGVGQVPLQGGEPSSVPGTEGSHIFRWPWAGRPADGSMRGATSLLNLSTGERLSAHPWGQCDVTWCIAGNQATRRDGGQTVDLPGDNSYSLVADRLVTITQTDRRGRKTMAVFDLATSQVGRLWIRDDHKASSTLYTSTEMLYFRRGDKWIVIHGPDR